MSGLQEILRRSLRDLRRGRGYQGSGDDSGAGERAITVWGGRTCGSPRRGAGSNCWNRVVKRSLTWRQRRSSALVSTHRRRSWWAENTHLHDRSQIPAPVAIVWSAKYGHALLFMAPLVPLHHQLVRPRTQLETVAMVELPGNVGAKDLRAQR
jgi:hypothetical protein